MSMTNYPTNNIRITETETFVSKLAEWLIKVASKPKSNLLVFTATVPAEPKSDLHKRINESIKTRIASIADDGNFKSKNISGYISYKSDNSNQVKVLSVTFGAYSGVVAEYEIKSFLSNAPVWTDGLDYTTHLPFLRMCLWIQTLERYMSGIDGLTEPALMNFARDKFLYSSGSREKFSPSIQRDVFDSSIISLTVSAPQLYMDKKKGDGLLFSLSNEGLLVFDRTKFNKASKKTRKTHYRGFIAAPKTEEAEEKLAEYATRLMDNRYPQEVHWMVKLTTFLEQVGISFEVVRFREDMDIKMDEQGIIPYLPISEMSKRVFQINYLMLNDYPDLTDEIKGCFSKVLEDFDLKYSINQVTNPDDANLFIGDLPTEVSLWKSIKDVSNADTYGLLRLNAIKDSKYRASQFIEFNNLLDVETDKDGEVVNSSPNKNVIKRSLLDLLLKIELESGQLKKAAEFTDMFSQYNDSKFIAFGSRLFAQKEVKEQKNDKGVLQKTVVDRKTFNYFSTIFRGASQNGSLEIGQPLTGWIPNFKKSKNMQGDFSNAVNDICELSQMHDEGLSAELLSLLSEAPMSKWASDYVNKRLSRSDTMLFFELSGEEGSESIEKIWSLEEKDANGISTLPIPDGYDSNKNIYLQFKELAENGNLSRTFKNNQSIYGDTVKLSRDPEYSVMLDGSTVLILRRRSANSLKFNDPRRWIKRYRLVWDRQTPEETRPVVKEEDIGLIVASLSSDYLGIIEDSGVKKTMLEKVVSCCIID